MSGDVQHEQLLARADASAALIARAADHTTPAETLAMLAWIGGEALERVLAAIPNTPSATLLTLLARCPAAVLSNPILPLLLAENPAWAQQAAESTLLRLPREPNCPAWARAEAAHRPSAALNAALRGPKTFPPHETHEALERAPVALWRLGLGGLIGRPLVLVTTRGLEYGKPRRTLLTPHWLGDCLYLWRPYGDPSQWYRNILACPLVTVQSTNGVRAARAVRPEDQAEVASVYGMLKGNDFDADLLRRYLQSVGIADTVSSVVANWQHVHVFRCDPAPDVTLPLQRADLLWVWPVAVGMGGLVALALVRRRRSGSALRKDERVW